MVNQPSNLMTPEQIKEDRHRQDEKQLVKIMFAVAIAGVLASIIFPFIL